MTQILVIDDDPESRRYVREAAPDNWTVLEAAGGIDGLDLVRAHLRSLDLIVLDMNLPDVEGRAVCARIRELSAELPILPFTAISRTVPALTEMGCLPAVIKPVRPSALAAALRAAPTEPFRPVSASPLLHWVQEQSGLLEQHARQEHHVLRVAVFASSQITRAGLARMVGLAAQAFEATTMPALERLLSGTRITALVSAANDHALVTPLAQQHKLPLILVASTAEQARAVHTPEVGAVVLETDPAAGVHLAQAIEAIASGARYVASPLSIQAAGSPGNHVPHEVVRRLAGDGLTAREQEVLWLDFQGLGNAEIARYLAIDPQTVASHWKGAQRKLGLSREEARAWVRRKLE
jgi:DNA-binding NarL/FixJ family response regulator